MLLQTTDTASPTLDTILGDFIASVVTAPPRLLAGVVFLTLAYLLIRLVLTISRPKLPIEGATE